MIRLIVSLIILFGFLYLIIKHIFKMFAEKDNKDSEIELKKIELEILKEQNKTKEKEYKN